MPDLPPWRSPPSEEQPTDAPAIDGDVLDLDRVFETLDHPRRRYLVYALATNGQWTLSELATKLASWERDVPEGDVSERTRDRVYTSLYHAHVPKLADHDVIRFDDGTETVSTTAHTDQVLAALESVGASRDSQQEDHAGRTYAATDGPSTDEHDAESHE